MNQSPPTSFSSRCLAWLGCWLALLFVFFAPSNVSASLVKRTEVIAAAADAQNPLLNLSGCETAARLFCGNDPVNLHDPLGLESEVVGSTYVIVNDRLKQFYVGETARDLFDKNGRFNDGQKYGTPHPAESLLKEEGTKVFSRNILAEKGWGEGMDSNSFSAARDQIKRAMESVEFDSVSKQLEGYTALNKRGMMDAETVAAIRKDYGARRSPALMEHKYEVKGAWARLRGASLFSSCGSPPVRARIMSMASTGAVLYGLCVRVASQEANAEAAEDYEDRVFAMMSEVQSGNMDQAKLISMIKDFAAEQTAGTAAQHPLARELERRLGVGSGNVADDIRAAVEL